MFIDKWSKHWGSIGVLHRKNPQTIREEENHLNSTFQEKVAIVTGAAGQLGRAVSTQLEAHGANLVLFDRKEGRLSKLYPHAKNSSQLLLIETVDLVDQQSVRRAVEQVFSEFNQIDILVNAAGGYQAGDPTHATTDDSWDHMFDLNVRTLLNTTRTVVPHMLKRSYGKVINIGARPGLRGTKGAAAYSAAKSAVLRITESMAAELKDEGINVNAVIPGLLDTPANRESFPQSDHDRWVSLDEVAKVILFLASDDANAVHGILLPVLGRS